MSARHIPALAAIKKGASYIKQRKCSQLPQYIVNTARALTMLTTTRLRLHSLTSQLGSLSAQILFCCIQGCPHPHLNGPLTHQTHNYQLSS